MINISNVNLFNSYNSDNDLFNVLKSLPHVNFWDTDNERDNKFFETLSQVMLYNGFLLFDDIRKNLNINYIKVWDILIKPDIENKVFKLFPAEFVNRFGEKLENDEKERKGLMRNLKRFLWQLQYKLNGLFKNFKRIDEVDEKGLLLMRNDNDTLEHVDIFDFDCVLELVGINHIKNKAVNLYIVDALDLTEFEGWLPKNHHEFPEYHIIHHFVEYNSEYNKFSPFSIQKYESMMKDEKYRNMIKQFLYLNKNEFIYKEQKYNYFLWYIPNEVIEQAYNLISRGKCFTYHDVYEMKLLINKYGYEMFPDLINSQFMKLLNDLLIMNVNYFIHDDGKVSIRDKVFKRIIKKLFGKIEYDHEENEFETWLGMLNIEQPEILSDYYSWNMKDYDKFNKLTGNDSINNDRIDLFMKVKKCLIDNIDEITNVIVQGL